MSPPSSSLHFSFVVDRRWALPGDKPRFKSLPCWSLYCLTLNSFLEVRNNLHKIQFVWSLNFYFSAHKIALATSQDLYKQRTLQFLFNINYKHLLNAYLGSYPVGKKIRLNPGPCIAYTQMWPLLALHKIGNICFWYPLIIQCLTASMAPFWAQSS